MGSDTPSTCMSPTFFHVRHGECCCRGDFSLIADSQDEDALREMVRQTKVVITTAGPYTLYGSTLVKVCAENGVSRRLE